MNRNFSLKYFLISAVFFAWARLFFGIISFSTLFFTGVTIFILDSLHGKGNFILLEWLTILGLSYLMTLIEYYTGWGSYYSAELFMPLLFSFALSGLFIVFEEMDVKVKLVLISITYLVRTLLTFNAYIITYYIFLEIFAVLSIIFKDF